MDRHHLDTSAPRAWNNLTDNIRMLETLPTFKCNIIDYIY